MTTTAAIPAVTRGMWIFDIRLDCGHPLAVTLQAVRDNTSGLWWCTPCGSGNHVEEDYAR